MRAAFTLFALSSLFGPGFLPAAAQPGSSARTSHELFVTADRCMACHNGLVTPSGEDVSIGSNWRASMMANAARDPYWHAAVRREVLDHPTAQAAIENECAACHMPMDRFRAKVEGRKGEVFSHLPALQSGGYSDQLAADGASCTVCHQILDDGFGERESFTGGFAVDTETPFGQRSIFGPYEVDAGRTTIMRSASEFQPVQVSHIRSSELCATCHTLFTHTLGPGGEAIGELPEQVPYLEWRHSAYRDRQSCQSCHMSPVTEETAISSVLGEPRSGFSRHAFRGGNFFMPRIFNRYRDELGVVAPAQELESTVLRTLEHLKSEAARVSITNSQVSAGRLRVQVSLENLAGHKLPTAYPSRRAWVRFSVRDRLGELLFESGRFNSDGSIQGNDNDADPALFEPHYDEIDSWEQIQIYEAIMADANDRVTTGLLSALRYVKDNRLLPEGFDKVTADEDIAVHGGARNDRDFVAGGDRIAYSVAVDEARGPFTVQAEFWYQPIAFRWAQNLRKQPAPETSRFVSYYESMSSASATVLTQDAVTVR